MIARIVVLLLFVAAGAIGVVAVFAPDPPPDSPTRPDHPGTASSALAPRAPATPGNLGGRVVDEEGRPVEGVAVSLVRSPDVVLVRTVTDRDGRFRLAPGRERSGVRLRAEKEGRVAPDLDLLYLDDSMNVRLVLGRTARVVARVLRAEDRGPIAGASVSTRQKDRTSRADWRRHAITDATGTVAFDAPHGRIGIRAEAEGRGRRSVDVVVVAGSPIEREILLPLPATLRGLVLDESSGEPIPEVRVLRGRDREEIARSDEAGLFELTGLDERIWFVLSGPWHAPANQSIRHLRPGTVEEREFRLARGARVLGTVVDAVGEAVPGAWVGTSWHSVAARFEHNSPTHRVAISGDDGSFVLDGQAPGDGKRVFALSAHASGSSEPFSLELGREVRDVTLRLDEPRRAVLRLSMDGDDPPRRFGVRIVDGADHPWAPPGASVSGYHPGRFVDGAFVLPALRRGAWRIELRAPGYLPVPLDAGSLLPHDGETERIVDVRLERGESISGTVWSAGGRPVSRARVEARLEGVTRYETAHADSDGSGEFEIRGLRSGLHTLRVTIQGKTAAERKGVKSGTRGIEVFTGELGTITGTCRAPEEPEARPGGPSLLLAYREKGDGTLGRSHADLVYGQVSRGEYRMSLNPGAWWILAHDMHRRWATPPATRIVVASGPQDGPGFLLQRGGTIRGTVRGPAGPAVNALVIAYPRPVTIDQSSNAFRGDIGTYLEARTDAKGVFVLRRAGTGTWTVRAYHPSGLPGTGTATLIEEGGSTPCHLALRPGAWIEVEVHAPGTGPFTVRSGISASTPSSESPNDGRFQDRSLPEAERRALRSGRRVGSGDRIRLGPFESGKVGLWARATLPVPGSDATVEVYRNATVEMKAGATTRVTLRFEPDAGR